MDYTNLFKYIDSTKFSLNISRKKDVLQIFFNNCIINCKYIPIVGIIDSKLYWACDNMFNDDETIKITKKIKNYLTNIHGKDIDANDLTKNLLNNLYNFEDLNIIWYTTIINYNNINNINQIYVITDIINF